MPYKYIWLEKDERKNTLFAHTIFVKTGCTSQLLQGEMCRLSIDNTTRLIMNKNVFTKTLCHKIVLAMLAS